MASNRQWGSKGQQAGRREFSMRGFLYTGSGVQIRSVLKNKSTGMTLARTMVIVALLTCSGCGATQGTENHGGWRAVPGSPSGSRSTSPVVSLQLDTRRNVLFGTSSTASSTTLPPNAGVWRCRRPDVSSAWTDMKKEGIPPRLVPIAIDQERDILYSGSNDNSGSIGIWRCSNANGTNSWADMGLKTDASSDNSISALAYDPKRNILYVGTTLSGVWGCTGPEGTPLWRHISSEVDADGVETVVCDSAHDILYAGTDNGGVWRCDDPMSTSHWENTGGDLAAHQVLSLAYDTTRDVLYAGAQGSGLWRCTSPSTSPSWNNTGGAIKLWAIPSIVCDPKGGLVCVAALSKKLDGQGVWRSSATAGTFSWHRMNGAIGTSRVWSLSLDPIREIIYAGAEKGVWSHKWTGSSD